LGPSARHAGATASQQAQRACRRVTRSTAKQRTARVTLCHVAANSHLRALSGSAAVRPTDRTQHLHWPRDER
jgi:hypothetical protein